MANRIKLKNMFNATKIHNHNGQEYRDKPFCSYCGESLVVLTAREEYVCEACRHLIQPSDVFCSHCGEELFDSNKINHSFGGIRVDAGMFEAIKSKVEKK